MHHRIAPVAFVCPAVSRVPTVVGARTPATLIRDALIMDGHGTPAVRIVGGRIAAMRQLMPTPSDRVNDAHSLTLAPGFIGMHRHHERVPLVERTCLPMVSQGVATMVVGQDETGMGLAAEFARLDTQPNTVNVASYVGHGSVQRAVLGTDFTYWQSNSACCTRSETSPRERRRT